VLEASELCGPSVAMVAVGGQCVLRSSGQLHAVTASLVSSH
jgi:hypothetical protein